MLIQPSLIEGSIARASRSKLHPAELARTLGEGDRAKRASPEQRRARLAQLMTQTGDPERARTLLERVLGGNDLVPVNYLEWGVIVGRAVCRVRLRDSHGATVGYGTGSLVAPGVVMTNHHVIPGIDDAKGAQAEFDYQLDLQGKEKQPVVFEMNVSPGPIAVESLDFCLVSVSDHSTDGARALGEFGWLMLNPTPGKTVVGEYLTIIQHPGGERKQVCVRENKLIKYDDSGNTLWYNTDTVAGSSGSPVFNNSWEVVALHHSGVPKTDAQGRWLTVDGKVWDASMDESQVAWQANEGIRISRILEHLRGAYASHPLAQALLTPTPAPLPERTSMNMPGQRSENVNGELRVTIPVQIAIKVGAVAGPAAAPSTASAQPISPVASKTLLAGGGTGIEKVEVDQSNYSKRTGYKSDFLGTSTPVPLPRVKDSALKSQVLTFTVAGKKESQLKYWDYSVVMHKARKLAIYSAVNVDAHQRPADSNREGDRWYFDTRLQESDQIGQEFYGQQTTFEADRSLNSFDRGHLTRRMDAQWGKDDQIAKRNGDDSFHFTNCSPQHWRFNQGQKRWLGLEDYVIDTFAGDTGKACVINGPVFDAPLSHKGADGRIVPNLGGAGRKDPTFGGVAIPKMFFKVVACRSNGTLSAAAFLMSQEDFLVTVDRLKGMPPIEEERLTTPEARLYQVSIADLENLTGLDFGPLISAESGLPEAIRARGPRVISEFRDIRLG